MWNLSPLPAHPNGPPQQPSGGRHHETGENLLAKTEKRRQNKSLTPTERSLAAAEQRGATFASVQEEASRAAPTLGIALRANADVQLLGCLTMDILGSICLNMTLGGVYEPSQPQQSFFDLRDAVLEPTLFTKAAIQQVLDDVRPSIARRPVRRQ